MMIALVEVFDTAYVWSLEENVLWFYMLLLYNLKAWYFMQKIF